LLMTSKSGIAFGTSMLVKVDPSARENDESRTA